MKKINCVYTLTLNPSIDYVVNIKNINIGETNRTYNEVATCGGKGINVSIVLNELGMNTKALGYVGGFTGNKIIDELERLGIESSFVNIKGDTRINVKINTGEITELNGSGPLITEEEKEALKSILSKTKSDDFAVFSGSVPRGLSENIYSELAKYINCDFALDTGGKYLKSCLSLKPYLIKPNLDELNAMFNVEINSIDDVIKYGKLLVNMGAKNVIVSLGEKGAVYLNNKDECYYQNSYKGVVKNTVGAGDSMVAAFIYAKYKDYSNVEAFKYAVAAGSACAFSDGLPSKDCIDKLYVDGGIG